MKLVHKNYLTIYCIQKLRNFTQYSYFFWTCLDYYFYLCCISVRDLLLLIQFRDFCYYLYKICYHFHSQYIQQNILSRVDRSVSHQPLYYTNSRKRSIPVSVPLLHVILLQLRSKAKYVASYKELVLTRSSCSCNQVEKSSSEL